MEHHPDLTPDLDQARRHLRTIDPSAETFVFQTFDDSPAKNRELARVIPGTLDQCAAKLTELNRRGAGVFVTVNKSRNGGRKKEDIVTYRAIFREADAPNLPDLPIEPHLDVETSEGKHHEYILIEPTDDGETWDRIMETMVDRLGSDPNAKDRSRVLRLPGFYHRKSIPHMVRIVRESSRPPLPLDEVARHIPPAATRTVPASPPPKNPGKYGASALARELAELACASEGTRNAALNKAAYALGQLIAGGELDRGQVETALSATAISIGLSAAEAKATLQSGITSGMKDPRTAPKPEAPPAVTQSPGKDSSQVKRTDECLLSPRDLKKEVFRLYDCGENRGVSTGWKTLDPHYTVKLAEMTVITGIPGSGKSNFMDALMVNLSKSCGWKFAVFSPENWPVERHLQGILEKFEEMPFAKAGRVTPRMDRGVLDGLIEAIDGNFHFIVPSEDDLLTVENVLETAKRAVSKYGVKGIIIDPWNELDHQYENKTEAQYLSEKLTKIRRFARMNAVHVWVVAHPKNLIQDKEGGYRPPTMYEISGGAHWRNKADNGLCIHRPDFIVNKTEIYIQKIRFREVGKCGIVTLRYCLDTGRYSDDVSGEEG